MILPKNPENIMGGSRFQRAGFTEGWSKKRNVDEHKEEAAEVSRPRNEGGAAGESLSYGKSGWKAGERKTEN